MPGDVLDEPVGVLAHTEEVGLLGSRRDDRAALRALAVHDLGLGVEGLALLTVHALVLALVDVALIVHLFEHFLDLALVILVRRADELVVGRVHKVPDALHLAGGRVDILLRRPAGRSGAVLDLLAVFVGSGLEEDVIALLALPARDRVGQDDLVGISDVRLARCVGDRRRNIVFSFISHSKPPS